MFKKVFAVMAVLLPIFLFSACTGNGELDVETNLSDMNMETVDKALTGEDKNETEKIKLNKDEWLSKDDSGKIKIFSFNIKGGGEGINSEEQRKPRIIELLRDYYPDIIGFQEVNSVWYDWFNTDIFSDVYSFYGKPRDPENSKSERSLIMYNHHRFNLINSGDFWLNQDVYDDLKSASTAVGWDAKYQRVCSWVQLEDRESGKQFVVMNVHFDHKGVQARIKSAELMVKMADTWDIPVVITGDFNASEASGAYKIMLGGDYENVKYVAQSTMSWATSPGFYNEGTEFGEVIDHIFVSKGIFDVDSYAVIKEKYGGGRVSDHYPVYAVISFK